jgi:hypothetical protein
MKTKDLIHDSIQRAAGLLKSMTADTTYEELHWNPPGTAHSVAATYAHAVLATDWQIHSLFEGETPRFAADWAGKIGISEPQVAQTLEWAQTVRLDMSVFQEYAKVVFDEALAYCDGLSEEDLSRPIDVSVVHAGEQPLSWCLRTLVFEHLHQLAGEISAAKGVKGLKGYPF